jgi:hypothetical protein
MLIHCKCNYLKEMEWKRRDKPRQGQAIDTNPTSDCDPDTDAFACCFDFGNIHLFPHPLLNLPSFPGEKRWLSPISKKPKSKPGTRRSQEDLGSSVVLQDGVGGGEGDLLLLRISVNEHRCLSAPANRQKLGLPLKTSFFKSHFTLTVTDMTSCLSCFGSEITVSKRSSLLPGATKGPPDGRLRGK